MDSFDAGKIEAYAARAKASWGNTPEYREYEQKTKGRTRADNSALQAQMMAIFSAFGAVRGEDPACAEAQALVRKLQAFITDHFYTCSDDILHSLGGMYAEGGEMTKNIDARCGEGVARFAAEAIRVHCAK